MNEIRSEFIQITCVTEDSAPYVQEWDLEDFIEKQDRQKAAKLKIGESFSAVEDEIMYVYTRVNKF